jgi:hypothetical protein
MKRPLKFPPTDQETSFLVAYNALQVLYTNVDLKIVKTHMGNEG